MKELASDAGRAGTNNASKRSVHAALAGNVAVAITKLVAAVVTGSSAMFSEAVHSFVDTGNEILLLYGYRQSAQRPNQVHPFGYGRELYFWSFIVALLLFAVGAGVSIYQGIHHVLSPQPIERVAVTYAVLALSFLFEGASWIVGWKAFSRARGGLGFWMAFRRSKDPPAFMVLFEDTAALVGILVAATGIFLADTFAMPVLDGVASILIGLVLAVTAVLLAMESKSLLIGERASPELVAAICEVARQEPGVAFVGSALTAQLAPNQALVGLSIQFDDKLMAADVEACVASIERKVKNLHPDVVALFVKPQTSSQFQEAVRLRFGGDADGPATRTPP
ncbi:cation diffusion facilitator family transporter [Lysobacter solisilvae (ex Woo and Kim 2020)]|uniref:Cation transporter n=1 Tax=Agrilutibacter terrestris TaxID=2865112 RepID=A0A7H0G147_9GAMM|nr:cation diffusion facilitator family transporter [Lysobacter terrestris]QNP42013.1 cation transporter [Lysobacter terrestris]